MTAPLIYLAMSLSDSFSEVFVLKTTDRKKGTSSLLSKFDLKDYYGKTVALKANYNSADPFQHLHT